MIDLEELRNQEHSHTREYIRLAETQAQLALQLNKNNTSVARASDVVSYRKATFMAQRSHILSAPDSGFTTLERGMQLRHKVKTIKNSKKSVLDGIRAQQLAVKNRDITKSKIQSTENQLEHHGHELGKIREIKTEVQEIIAHEFVSEMWGIKKIVHEREVVEIERLHEALEEDTCVSSVLLGNSPESLVIDTSLHSAPVIHGITEQNFFSHAQQNSSQNSGDDNDAQSSDSDVSGTIDWQSVSGQESTPLNSAVVTIENQDGRASEMHLESSSSSDVSIELRGGLFSTFHNNKIVDGLSSDLKSKGIELNRFVVLPLKS